MKIIQQLATWLLKNDRITPDEYQNVLTAIMGEIGDEEKALLSRSRVMERAQHAAEDSFETWWDLRGAGERAHVRATHRKGGRRPSQDATPVRVWDLDPQIADMLLPAGAAIDAFPLARLLLAVDGACGNHRTADWTGFAAAVDSLYKTDAEKLHDALLATMKAQGIAIGQILSDAEMGSTLFPEGFLSKLDGESVVALRKRIDGDETSFAMNKEDWILKYPSFNVLNEACLVRNRIRRIYRLWVKSFAEFDKYGATQYGYPSICLTFGDTLVHVPAVVWWKLVGPQIPQDGPFRGMMAFPNVSLCLNIRVNGQPVFMYEGQCIAPPNPPCRLYCILDDGLNKLPDPIKFVLPEVRQNEPTPVLTMPEAHETVGWSPDYWLYAVARNYTLSTGVSAEDACPWHLFQLVPPDEDSWIDLLLWRRDKEFDIPWHMIKSQRIPERKWVRLLTSRPEFAGHAPWCNFSPDNLAVLFSDQPILQTTCDINAISPYCLEHLISSHAEFAESCLTRLVNGATWSRLMDKNPEWSEYCKWQDLSIESWSAILRDHPEYADLCDLEKMDGWAWSNILQKQPQFADLCDWSRLGKWDWVKLILDQPQFIEHCDIDKLDAEALDILLSSSASPAVKKRLQHSA